MTFRDFFRLIILGRPISGKQQGHFTIFLFFQVSGISFAFDGSKEPGSRIDPQFIKVGDEYVGPDKVYRMVTKAYLANGKDGYDVLGKCNQVRKLF